MDVVFPQRGQVPSLQLLVGLDSVEPLEDHVVGGGGGGAGALQLHLDTWWVKTILDSVQYYYLDERLLESAATRLVSDV